MLRGRGFSSLFAKAQESSFCEVDLRARRSNFIELDGPAPETTSPADRPGMGKLKARFAAKRHVTGSP